jgi:hypothetical protein
MPHDDLFQVDKCGGTQRNGDCIEAEVLVLLHVGAWRDTLLLRYAPALVFGIRGDAGRAEGVATDTGLDAGRLRAPLNHPVARILHINALAQVTTPIVDAARESLVIGVA